MAAPLRLKVIACEVLARHVYQRAATSPHVIDVELLEKRLHENAGSLRAELQRRIDATPSPPYDAVVLVYGLCNRATEGLVARNAPLAIARAHDCITLYLGSRERYATQFQDHPGTYYYSAEYLERGKDGRPAGADSPATADEGMAFGSRMPVRYEELVQQYGEDNARYLAEVYGSWHQHYDRAALIRLPCARCGVGEAQVASCAHVAPFRHRAVSMASRHEWAYAELEGDLALLHRLLDGEWSPDHLDQDDILVVPPGMAIRATFDERVVVAAPIG